MESLGPVIDGAVAIPEQEPDARAGLERIRTALGFIGKRLASADPAVVAVASLDRLASAVSSARGEIESLISSSNPASLDNANLHIDNAIQICSEVLFPQAPDDFTVLSEAAGTYRITLQRNLEAASSEFTALRSQVKDSSESFRTDVSELKSAVDELAAKVQVERGVISKLTSDQQEQFAKSQEARSTDFSASVQNALGQLTQLSSDHQNQFSAAQERRSTEFTEAQTTRQTKFHEALDGYSLALREADSAATKDREALLRSQQEELSKLTASYQEKAGEILSRVQSNERDVEKLVGVIGNLGVTSGYLLTANSARKSLWLWQSIAVAAMAGLIVIAVIMFFPSISGNNTAFSWAGFAGRVFITLTFGALAAYAAKQADNFFEVERRNRKLALEFEAVGPYIAPLTPEEQNQFRILMGHRSFGQEDAKPTESKRSPATTLDMLLTILNSKEFQEILELAKKAKG
jgi:hypothetical protein